MKNAEAFLKDLFMAAVKSADPINAVPLPLGTPPLGRTFVVGAGKASPAFAAALEKTLALSSRTVEQSFIITPHGSLAGANSYKGTLKLFEAAHPVPDEYSLEGASHILDLARTLGPGDELIVLLSGGGSSLMTLPLHGITLEDKMNITNQLLKSGAPIHHINVVRKNLSAIKGGKLAQAAFPARVTTLAISDVVGDDPAIIASGPTVEDPSSPAQALDSLERHHIKIPASVRLALETPRPAETKALRGNTAYQLIATPGHALEAAQTRARETGPANLQIHSLGAALEGGASQVATRHAQMARDLKASGGCHLILSGGELTCHLPANLTDKTHTGGPNHVYVAALLKALGDEPGIYMLAADTDGKDGTTAAAGAFAGPGDLARAQSLGLDLEKAITTHNTGHFFARLANQVVTGPTWTNVNDLRAILIEG